MVETAHQRPHTWPRASFLTEAGGLLAGLIVGAVALAHLANTPRSWILFYDGDSVLPLLVRSSLRIGQTQEWILSSPLFLIEAIVYLPSVLLDLPPRVLMVLFGLIGWIGLYLAARAVSAVLPLARSWRVRAAVLMVSAVGIMALCESSADRNSLEPASLISTTTYYSATILGTVAAVAIAARIVSHSQTDRLWPLVVGLGALTAVSTMSNPLFLAWAALPLGLVAVLVAHCGVPPRRIRLALLALVSGGALGMLARIPFGPVLVQDSLAKVQPGRALESAAYYFALLRDRLSTWTGWLELFIVLTLVAGATAMTLKSAGKREPALTLISAFAVIAPLTALLGAIAAGTFAARYLEPIVFFSALALIPGVGLLRSVVGQLSALADRRLLRLTWAVATACIFGVFGIFAVVQLARLVPSGDQSIACVADWIDDSGQTGAGQFWTVRAPKAEIRDPRQLIQVDSTLNGYSWLTNADDFQRAEVSFVLVDEQSVAFDLPESLDVKSVGCGRYTILNFAPAHLTVGPAHH
jgi:hypothetical protein